MLPLTLAHDTGLLMIDQKTFFQCDRGDQHFEALGFPAKTHVSRECEGPGASFSGGTGRCQPGRVPVLGCKSWAH